MKLFELYNFNDVEYSAKSVTTKIHGIWQIQSVYAPQDPKERMWGLKRIATFDNLYPVGDETLFPDIVFRLYGKRINPKSLFGESAERPENESEKKAGDE